MVVVAVKVPEHKQIVSDALAAGKMVYCEWPLARNLSEAEALGGLARERQLKTVIGLQGGLHPPIRYLRDLVRQGVIGMPLGPEHPKRIWPTPCGSADMTRRSSTWLAQRMAPRF